MKVKYSKTVTANIEVTYVPLPEEKRAQYNEGMRIFVELARRYKAKRMAEGTWNVDDAGVPLALEEPEHSGWVEVHPLPTHREERANPGSPKPTVWRRGNGEGEKTVEEADE